MTKDTGLAEIMFYFFCRTSWNKDIAPPILKKTPFSQTYTMINSSYLRQTLVDFSRLVLELLKSSGTCCKESGIHRNPARRGYKGMDDLPSLFSWLQVLKRRPASRKKLKNTLLQAFHRS
jgi:hypothetical protein